MSSSSDLVRSTAVTRLLCVPHIAENAQILHVLALFADVNVHDPASHNYYQVSSQLPQKERTCH